MPKLRMQNGDVKCQERIIGRIIHGYEPHEPTNTFSFYKKPFCFAKAFTKLLEKVLSKALRGNMLRRKPVLKKKNLISASLKNLQNLLEIFFNKIFFLKRKVLWCFLCGLRILGMRIRWWISEKLRGKYKY